MKKLKFFILLYALLFYASSFGQKTEVRFSSGLGIDPKNIDAKTAWLPNVNHTYSILMDLDVNHNFYKRSNYAFYIGSGLKYLDNKYYQIFRHHAYQYGLDEIHFSHKHLILPFRLGLEINLFNENTLGFDYELQYNLAMSKSFVREMEGTRFFNNSLAYNYHLAGRVNNFFSNNFSVFIKTQLSKQTSLVSGIDFSIRRPSGTADFRMIQTQTITDIESGAETQIRHDYSYSNQPIKTNLLFLNIGITRTISQKYKVIEKGM